MDGQLFLGLVGAVVAIAGSVFVFIKGRGENRNKTAEIKLALDKQIDERISRELNKSYVKVDELELVKVELSGELSSVKGEFQRQMGATRRVFRDVARQWTGAQPPLLHPEDVAILEETLPAAWRAS